MMYSHIPNDFVLYPRGVDVCYLCVFRGLFIVVNVASCVKIMLNIHLSICFLALLLQCITLMTLLMLLFFLCLFMLKYATIIIIAFCLIWSRDSSDYMNTRKLYEQTNLSEQERI